MGDNTITRKLTTGEAQGGITSPPFWNMTLNPLLAKYKQGPVKVVAFADDLKPGTSGTDINQLTALLQPVLDDIVAWGHTCGLTFSSSKTVAVLFSKHTKPLAFIPPLYLEGIEIEYI